jgi:bifunctional oligoribonuclease and PAP phosphatase NrnA
MTTSSMTTSSDADWARAVKVIDGASQVCLACHVRPDADALGSMLAVLDALCSRPGGPPSVVASFGDEPFEVPAILRFLPGVEQLTAPADYPAQPEVMLSFDAASIDRLGALTGPATAAGELIVLDHHASSTRFGTINLVDPAAAATAVLATDLIDRLAIPLTEQMALGLYAGLVTDTGSFKFSATTPQVHELAARLLSTGIDPGIVSRELPSTALSWTRMLRAGLALCGRR